MRNSNRPAGPGHNPQTRRDDANQKEQVEDTLNPQADEQRVPRTGGHASRSEPSPQPRNETTPGRDAG